jgi:hypothetical protein
MTLPPAVVIHGLAHARLAMAVGRPVALLSAPAAALYAGSGWWRAVIAAAGFEGPDVLDCADAPGRALEALSVGCRILVLRPCPAWDSVAGRAAGTGAVLLRARPAALDLGEKGAARRIAAWLGIG